MVRRIRPQLRIGIQAREVSALSPQRCDVPLTVSSVVNVAGAADDAEMEPGGPDTSKKIQIRYRLIDIPKSASPFLPHKPG